MLNDVLLWFLYWNAHQYRLVFNATFNNISVISLWSVLLVEESRVPGENNRPVVSHWQTLSHIVVSSTPHQYKYLQFCRGQYMFCWWSSWISDSYQKTPINFVKALQMTIQVQLGFNQFCMVQLCPMMVAIIGHSWTMQNWFKKK